MPSNLEARLLAGLLLFGTSRAGKGLEGPSLPSAGWLGPTPPLWQTKTPGRGSLGQPRKDLTGASCFGTTRLVFGVGLACTGSHRSLGPPARVAGASCYDLAKYESIVGVMPRILRSSPRSFRGYWAFRFLRSQSVRGAPIVPVSGASLKTIDNANIFLAEPPR